MLCELTRKYQAMSSYSVSLYSYLRKRAHWKIHQQYDIIAHITHKRKGSIFNVRPMICEHPSRLRFTSEWLGMHECLCVFVGVCAPFSQSPCTFLVKISEQSNLGTEVTVYTHYCITCIALDLSARLSPFPSSSPSDRYQAFFSPTGGQHTSWVEERWGGRLRCWSAVSLTPQVYVCVFAAINHLLIGYNLAFTVHRLVFVLELSNQVLSNSHSLKSL